MSTFVQLEAKNNLRCVEQYAGTHVCEKVSCPFGVIQMRVFARHAFAIPRCIPAET